MKGQRAKDDDFGGGDDVEGFYDEELMIMMDLRRDMVSRHQWEMTMTVGNDG